MRIVTPSAIEHVAWDGALVPLGATYRDVTSVPHVTLGEPAWWPAAQVLADERGTPWTPPAGNRRYTLVRLACTLHPPDDRRTRYTEATLTVDLRPRQGTGAVVAHDLYPQRLTADRTGTVTVKLAPTLT